MALICTTTLSATHTLTNRDTMEDSVKHIEPTFGSTQLNYFIAARQFFSRGTNVRVFNDRVKDIVGNVVYEGEMKQVGSYLRDLANSLNAKYHTKYELYVMPLKKMTDNNGMACQCYEVCANNGATTHQVCMVYLLRVNKQLHFYNK